MIIDYELLCHEHLHDQLIIVAVPPPIIAVEDGGSVMPTRERPLVLEDCVERIQGRLLLYALYVAREIQVLDGKVYARVQFPTLLLKLEPLQVYN